MSFVGENQDTTILDGVGSSTSTIISIDGYHSITLVNLTLQNASTGLQAQHCFNSTISHCVFSQCVGAAVELSDSENFLVTDSTFTFSTIGIQLTNCSSNQFYHNNFLNNTIHVSTFFNSSTNTWDNGATGNYWDNYRALYPNATVIPGTGTWTIPYVVNSTGNNTDYHPWVYPSGDIDTTPPQVHVIYPTGGEVVDGIITIQWSATDDYTTNLDGTILLEYSNDNGNNWFLLTSNYDNTGTFVWNTTTVPNGNRYLISVTATDEFSNVGSDTSDTTFTISNYWNIPPGSIQISGPSIGANGMYYNFTALAVDPEGDQVYYQWDWADGNISDWLGPYNASVLCTTSYAWVSDGLYNISVRARDIGGEESNWSTGHLISIQPLVEFTNIKLGYIYFNLFTFNRSYIYSNFLERLRVVFIISSHVLNADAWAADNVESVTFKASNLWQDNMVEIADNDSTDGFSCNFNMSAGMYELNVSAFDGNGTMVDKYSLPVVFYLRIGKYSMGPEDTSRHMLRLNRLRH
jgi:parallel beta-helix repeat protein